MSRCFCVLSLVWLLGGNVQAADAVMQVNATTPMQLSYVGGDRSDTVKFAAEELRDYCSRLLGTKLAWEIGEQDVSAGCYVIRLARAGSALPAVNKLPGGMAPIASKSRRIRSPLPPLIRPTCWEPCTSCWNRRGASGYTRGRKGNTFPARNA